MTATQQGRFCMSCQKEVVDFSTMTDVEILNYLSTASSKTCGRVDDSQLNRLLVAPQQKPRYSFKYAWSVLITSILIANKAPAQVKLPVNSVVTLPVDGPTRGEVLVVGKIAYRPPASKVTRQVSGIVLNESNEPVPFASVMVKGSSSGVSTDAAGRFTIAVSNDFKRVKLIVSSVGYTAQTIDCANYDLVLNTTAAEGKMNLQIGEVYLQTQMMGDVVVLSTQNCSRRVTTGTMGVIIYDTLYNAKSKFKDVFDINQIKSYPNPIAANGQFQLRYKLKETGDYQLRFTDALGRIVASTQVNIVSNNQVESFNAGLLGGNGVYFASISNKKTGKMYTTRLVLQ